MHPQSLSMTVCNARHAQAWGGGSSRAWMKCTPRWYAAAAKPHMSPITPPPSATNVVLRSMRASSALSHTCRGAPRRLMACFAEPPGALLALQLVLSSHYM